MMTSMPTVGDEALEYARASLSGGLSLSRMAASSLDGMTTFALVPDDLSGKNPADFASGGIGRCDFKDVAALLSRMHKNQSILVELPLWRHDDPGISSNDFRVLICGKELFATCSLDESLSVIERTLRSTDPSFMYNAIVLEHQILLQADSCPTSLVQAGAASITAVLVGAFDGEGFVYLTRNPHTL